MATPFAQPSRHGFVRVAAGCPAVLPAEPVANAAAILDLAHRAEAQGAAILVCPELSLSAYAIDDLLMQSALLEAVEAQIGVLAAASRDMQLLMAVGAPLQWRGRVFNCAVIIQGGRVLGVTPKSYLPTYREFYERRWFASGADVAGETLTLAGEAAPFGVDLLFEGGPETSPAGKGGFTLHAEICEDLWVANPPSGFAATAGAEVMINLSASNVTIGKAERRRMLCAAQSLRCEGAYVYAAAGPGESTTDLAWDGQAGVFELGETLAETARFPSEPQLCVVDVDIGRIRAERRRTSFGDAAAAEIRRSRELGRAWRRIPFAVAASAGAARPSCAPIPAFPSCPRIPRGWRPIATKLGTSRCRGCRGGWRRRR